MKKQKKSHYGLWGILMFCILAGICFAHPLKAEAATFKVDSLSVEGERAKAGKYYLWASGDTLYSSTSKTGKGKVVAKASKGCYIWGGFASDGSTIYYTELSDQESKDPFGYIYSVKISGKNRTRIGKLKNVYGIEAYYNGNLYIAYGSFDAMSTYRLNIKTKKGKRIQKNVIPCNQYKQYMLLFNGFGGNSHNAYIFNCKTEKSVKISSKVYRGLNFVSGKVYYAEKVNDTSVSIKTCSLTGKNKKTLVTKLSADIYNIGKITSKYVYYVKENKYYRYNIKTKKSNKISQSKFSW